MKRMFCTLLAASFIIQAVLALENHDLENNDAETDGINQSLEKPCITVSQGYAPIFPLVGEIIKESYDGGFYPLGIYARFGIIPFKKHWGSLGAELASQYGHLEGTVPGGSVKGNLIAVHIDAVYQKQFFDNELALNVKLGGGTAFLNHNAPYEKATSLFFIFNTGVGIQWRIFAWKNLSFDFYFYYNHLTDHIDGGQNGYITPFIGVGWKF